MRPWYFMDDDIKEIFSENSTSYYYSSLVFPKDVREDVFKLYAYVRTADDFVDDEPQNPEALEEMRENTFSNWESGRSGDKVVDLFLEVAREHGFKREWVEAFLDSMEMDLYRSEYEELDETLEYIYGSAEVIGLMMCAILDLDEEAFQSARMMGRAMQYCNFIRDIREDRELGRRYMPGEELKEYGLEDLSRGEAEETREEFEAFIQSQLEEYWRWQREAEKGLSHLPYRVRVPVILSSRLYKYTARKIGERPLRVYREQVRPSKPRIAFELMISLLGRK